MLVGKTIANVSHCTKGDDITFRLTAIAKSMIRAAVLFTVLVYTAGDREAVAAGTTTLSATCCDSSVICERLLTVWHLTAMGSPAHEKSISLGEISQWSQLVFSHLLLF